MVSSPPTPDELLARYRATGDPEALGALFDATAPALFRVARSVVGDAALAEDVLQETFLAVIGGAQLYDPDRPALPWLTGVLKRHAAGARRRRARRPDPQRVGAPGAPPGPGDAAAEREEVENLARAIEELPEPYRGVALMRWRYGLEPAEIAHIRGQAPGTVWSLLSRAKERLRRALVALPAVVVALRSERGLAGVRGAVLRRARSAAATAAGAGAGTVLVAAGGGVMAKKTVIAAAALLLLALGAGVTALLSSPTPRPPDGVVRLAAAGAKSPVRERVESSSPRDAGSAASAPVDLDAADRERDLFGIAVDAEGKPVGGVRVSVVRRPWTDWFSMVGDVRDIVEHGPATVTAADGMFLLRLERGEHVDLRAEHDDYAGFTVGWCQSGERVRLEMVRGGVLTVTVQHADGSPAAGAVVHAWTQSYWGDPTVDQRETTGDDGVARFPALLAVDYLMIEAAAPDGVVAPIDGVSVVAGMDIERTIVLPEGRTLRGTVTDAETGRPIPGARVSEGMYERRVVLTDESGRYELPGWTGLSYRDVSVRAEGYVWQRVTLPESDEVDFEMDPGDWVVGRIVREDGTPVAGARIVVQGRVATEDRSRSHFDAHAAVSADDGSFAVTGLDRELWHTIVVSAPGLGRTLRDVEPAAPAGEIDAGDIVMPAGRTISGVAHDKGGRLRAGVGVNLDGGNLAADRAPGTGVATPHALQRTDDLGRFRFPDLAAGTYVLRGGEDEVTVVVTDHDVSDIVLGTSDPAAAGRPVAALSFEVRDASGKPVPGAQVQVYSARAPTRTTDVDGVVTFEDLDVAPARWSVRDPHGVREHATVHGDAVVPGGQTIEVALQPLALITGIARDGEGSPLPRRSVFARDTESGEDRLGRTRDDGTFEIEADLGRTYRVRVGGDRQENLADGTMVFVPVPERGESAAFSAPASGVEVVARPPASTRGVTIAVVDPDGTPVPGANAQVTGAPPVRTDEDGRARFVGLPQEEAQVLVLPPAGDLLRAMTKVVPDDQVLTVTCARGVALTGRVLLPDGEPCAGADVVAGVPGRGFRSSPARTGDDGRFRLTVPPGAVLVVAAMRAAAAGEQMVALREGVRPVDGDVELRLQFGSLDSLR